MSESVKDRGHVPRFVLARESYECQCGFWHYKLRRVEHEFEFCLQRYAEHVLACELQQSKVSPSDELLELVLVAAREGRLKDAVDLTWIRKNLELF